MVLWGLHVLHGVVLHGTMDGCEKTLDNNKEEIRSFIRG